MVVLFLILATEISTSLIYQGRLNMEGGVSNYSISTGRSSCPSETTHEPLFIPYGSLS